MTDFDDFILQSSLPQNVKQVNAAFEVLLDILQHQMTGAAALQLTSQDTEELDLFFRGTANQALALGEDHL